MLDCMSTADTFVLVCVHAAPAGFDGQLSAKTNILRSCPLLFSSLSARSDLRGLAYTGLAEVFTWGSRVYAAGQPCAKGAVYIIQEGSCRVRAQVALPLAGSNSSMAVLPIALLSSFFSCTIPLCRSQQNMQQDK